MDKTKRVYVKGRVKKDDPKIKPYQISDTISRDTKNVMSCETVSIVNENGEHIYVVHIEPQFNKKINIKKMLISAEKRCIKELGESLKNKIFFNVRTDYPLTFALKRDVDALKMEGLTDSCIKIEDIEMLENKLDSSNLNKPKIKILK